MVKFKKQAPAPIKHIVKDKKRERLLLKMLEKKKKLAKAKELAFTFNPIRINWKHKMFKRFNFKLMDIMFAVLVRSLDEVRIVMVLAQCL